MSAETSSGNKIISLALSSGSDNLLIALTDTLQLMSFSIKDILTSNQAGASASAAGGKEGSGGDGETGPTVEKAARNEFSVFSYSFHNGAVTGVDVCHRKPLVVTCGADRSIRVWNYLSLELELSKEFEEAVESMALHPTGK